MVDGLGPGQVDHHLERISRALLAAVHPECTNPVPMALDAPPAGSGRGAAEVR